MSERSRPSNPVAEGFDRLLGLDRHRDEARAIKADPRFTMTAWQRAREEAAFYVFGAIVFIGAPAIVFGPWLVGAWVILRWAFGL